MKIQITIESREDGGLRVYSDDLPGLILSGAQSEKVIEDISPALLVILKYFSEHPKQAPWEGAPL